MRPSPPVSRSLDPVFRADKVTLAVSAEKDGNLRVNYAGWDDHKVVLPGEVLELRSNGAQVEGVIRPRRQGKR